MFWTEILDLIFGIGVVILQVGIVGLVLLHHFGRSSSLYRWLGNNKISLAFLLALAATLGSLVYSEIVGLEPCLFCWWQRVVIYPQALLLGVAWWKKEGGIIKKYALGLSVIGVILATYHYMAQKLAIVATTVNCDVAGAASCSGSYMNVFGYITIPMMSLTILVAIILLLSVRNK